MTEYVSKSGTVRDWPLDDEGQPDLAAMTLVQRVEWSHDTAELGESYKRAARIEAARSTRTAILTGEIGENGTWSNQHEYAVALGVSDGSITGLKRLGAMLAAGIDPDGDDRDLWSKVSSAAGTKEVGAMVEGEVGEDFTAESIRSDYAEVWTPDGKKIKAPVVESPEEDAAPEPITPEQALAVLIDTLDRADDAWLRALPKAVKDAVTREQGMRKSEQATG